VKAVINVGCCYNLLTEECSSVTGETTKDSMSGFPLSKGVRHLGLHLGKNGRDLACQVYHSSGHAPRIWNLHGLHHHHVLWKCSRKTDLSLCNTYSQICNTRSSICAIDGVTFVSCAADNEQNECCVCGGCRVQKGGGMICLNQHCGILSLMPFELPYSWYVSFSLVFPVWLKAELQGDAWNLGYVS
jgi:hypothetical protein